MNYRKSVNQAGAVSPAILNLKTIDWLWTAGDTKPRLYKANKIYFLAKK